MTPRHAVALAATVPLGAAALLSGCASSSPSASSTTAAAGSSVTRTAPSPANATVDIVDYDFSPNTITVAAGTTVSWTNQDGFDHWIVSSPQSPVTFDLGRQGHGQTVSFTFDAPGTYPYYCNLHNYMKGTVVVR